MTREEAIEYWEGFRKTFSAQLEKEESYFGRMHLQTTIDVLDTTISALRQQEVESKLKVVESNKPLTLDELRKMDGEPVWWWNKSAKPVCTICVWDRFMDEPMFANYDWQSEDTLKLSKYKWLKKCGYKPYRQKPEEGTD